MNDYFSLFQWGSDEVNKVKRQREDQANKQRGFLEQQKQKQDREAAKAEEQRRREAKKIFAEKKAKGWLNPSNDYTVVPAPHGGLPTTRPDLVKVGPGNEVEIEAGGNITIKPGSSGFGCVGGGTITPSHGMKITYESNGQPAIHVKGGITSVAK